MQVSDGYRELVMKLVSAKSEPAGSNVRVHESWETLVLGLVSTAIGVGVLIVALYGMRNIRVEGFNVEKPTARYNGNTPIQFLAPSWQSALAAVAGECVGLIGIVVGRWRRSAISILCVLGTVICLLHMVLFYVHVRFLT
jgi:hypothetical protein